MFFANPSLPFLGLSIIADVAGQTGGGFTFGQELVLAAIPATAGIAVAVFAAIRGERPAARRRRKTKQPDEPTDSAEATQEKYVQALEADRVADRARIAILEAELAKRKRP